MVLHSDLVFDARKLYFFAVLVAILYGLSPSISNWIFYRETPLLVEYEIYFLICGALFFLITYPFNRLFKSKIEVNETRLLIGMLVTAAAFIFIQIELYGDFTTAFVIAYNERTGAELNDGIRFIFYPIITIFISTVLLLSTHLYLRRDRINIVSLSILAGSIIIFSALGSRNLLLWSFSAVLALFISKLRYSHITLLIVVMYLLAVLFAYARNNGFVSYLFGNIDKLYGPLTWNYFDPMVHEFASSYRTFTTIYYAKAELEDAPYGQLTSFFVNQLPSLIKPSNFIGFTDYISLKFAEPGEGIGSSPMTEAHLSGILSLASLTVVTTAVYWPAYYLRRFPALSFFTYALSVAVAFNIWRIGSAEILKMFASSAITLFVLAKLFGFRVLSFRTSN